MTVIADARPIISYARSRYEHLLHQVFSQFIIPEAVYTEVVTRGGEQPGVSLVRESSWIHRVIVQDKAKVALLPRSLGRGEREAIILAEERSASLLTDDRAARREAGKRGIQYFGSLRVLREAKDAGIIATITPVAAALRQAGLRLSDRLYQEFLQEMGE